MSEAAERFRQPKGGWAVLVHIVTVLVPILGCLYILRLHTYLGLTLYAQQYIGLILGLLLALTFVLKPATKGGPRDMVPWYDVILVIVGLLLAFYVGFLYPKEAGIYLSYLNPRKILVGAVAIAVVLEATRRLIGWPLPILALLFILYGRYTESLPGPLATAGMSWSRMAVSLFLDPGAMLGIPIRIGTTMLLGFLIFGAFLALCGGREFITEFSLSLMGKYRGGPAKVAVAASAIAGSLYGSAVANAVTTGMITIPMMKKTGYTPEFAAAVEATASTGGMVLPPVMGATAFMMAEFLGITYAQVVIAALVPALLYYLCLFMQVDLEAGKTGLKGLPPEELPPLAKTMTKGWLTGLAFFVLIYCLFALGLTPQRAALYGAGTIIVGGLIRKETRLSLRSFMAGLQATTRDMLDVVMVCAAAGVIIGVTMMTGVAVLMSTILVNLAGGNVILLLIMIAVVSIIMGMGMPGIISYILLAILVAPALITAGMNPLASHLFIMYYGILSFITPPVCVAIYITATIAGASATRAGFRAVGLGITAYLVPFMFVFNEGLVMSGSPIGIIRSVVMAIIACFLLAAMVEGYFLSRLKAGTRTLMGVAAVALLVPLGGWITDAVGLCMAIAVLGHEMRVRRTRPALGLGGQ